jgi:hypothetical protein
MMNEDTSFVLVMFILFGLPSLMVGLAAIAKILKGGPK